MQNDEDNLFDIGNEDGEEDVVNIVTEVDKNAGDVIMDEEELDYSEITIEEHWLTSWVSPFIFFFFSIFNITAFEEIQNYTDVSYGIFMADFSFATMKSIVIVITLHL